MKTTSLILIVLAVVLILSFLSIRFYPSVQDFMSSNTMWNGVRNFTANFDAQEVDALSDLPETENPAGDRSSLLVAIPYLEYTQEELSEMERFVISGNVILLLDDFGYGNRFLEQLGIGARFGNQVLLDPLFSYKNQYLPRITDFSPEIKDSGIKSITLNHAAVLNQVEPGQVLAWSSTTSFVDSNANGTKDPDEVTGPLAVAAEYPIGSGKLILVGDPSLIINTMVNQDDNRKFIEYLSARNGEPQSILLDRSHLSKSPLDVSKINLEGVLTVLAEPYILIVLVAAVFILVPLFLRKPNML